MAPAKWVARAVYAAVLVLALGLAWSTLHEDAEVPVVVVAPLPPRPPPPPPPPERGDDGAPIDAPPVAVPPEVLPPPSLLPPPTPSAPHATGPRLPNHAVDQEALAREAELINRAHAEVASDPQTALKTLAEHHQKFPHGELEQDEELTRVEALLRLGRRQEAETLARKLGGRDGALKKTLDRLLSDARPN